MAGSVDWMIAQVASRDPVMGKVAHRVARRARRVAKQHYHTGGYHRGVRAYPVVTRRGIRDWVVAVDRSVVGHIEFGHMSRGGRWVPGLHILHRAAIREGRASSAAASVRGRRVRHAKRHTAKRGRGRRRKWPKP